MMRRLLVVAVAAAMLLGVPLAFHAAGEETDLGGYQMTAQATAISFIYNQPSFGLPTDPTFELRKVQSLATTDSGPSGRALSSAVWPGDAAGNADPALILDLVMFDPTRDSTPEDGGFFSPYIPQIRESMKAGISEECKTSSCTYPLRAEAFYPEAEGHPSFSSYPAGSVQMRSRAQQSVSEAQTFTNDTGEPNMFFVGGMSSYTITEVRNGVAIAKAVTHLSKVSVLGLFSFDAIDTVAEVTSNGKVAKPKTSVKITGMSIDLQCRQPGADPKTCSVPIYVDRDGFHVRNDKYDPTGGQAAPLFAELRNNGFDIVVTPSSSRVDSESAQGFGAVNGLIIRMSSGGMNKLVDAIPNEDLKTWIRSPSHKSSPLKSLFEFLAPTVAGYATSFTQGDQTMSIVLGDASVDAAAAPAYSFDIPDIDVPVIDTPLPPATGGGDLGGGGFSGGGTAPPTGPRRGTTIIDAVPIAVKGLPGLAGAFIVLIGALAAFLLRRFADRVTAAVPADVCPLEAE